MRVMGSRGRVRSASSVAPARLRALLATALRGGAVNPSMGATDSFPGIGPPRWAVPSRRYRCITSCGRCSRGDVLNQPCHPAVGVLGAAVLDIQQALAQLGRHFVAFRMLDGAVL